MQMLVSLGIDELCAVRSRPYCRGIGREGSTALNFGSFAYFVVLLLTCGLAYSSVLNFQAYEKIQLNKVKFMFDRNMGSKI